MTPVACSPVLSANVYADAGASKASACSGSDREGISAIEDEGEEQTELVEASPAQRFASNFGKNTDSVL
jgi:hypothetical protein